MLEATKENIEKHFFSVNLNTHTVNVSKKLDLMKMTKEVET